MKTKTKQNRKSWFKGLKVFLKIFVRKPKFVYLGDQISTPSIILSNHVGARGPVKLELYLDKPFRFWGTYEMNSNIKSIYKYLSNIYFYKKKHMPKFLAKIVGFVACPFLKLFYSGLNLISTYPDVRFRKSIKESLKTINSNQNLVIFPEDSSNGYHDTLLSFYSGFVFFADICLKQGKDLPIYVMYFKRKENTFIVDKPIMYSELANMKLDKKDVAKMLCDKANSLSSVDVEKNKK
ncbi:MAG: hypothetical protein IJD48_04230 [Clostridia bacterium]|nr:hypothetical protein [Clostridia bacterium]